MPTKVVTHNRNTKSTQARDLSMLCTAIAIIGTAAWAIELGNAPTDPRLPIIAAGTIAAISFIIVPIQLPVALQTAARTGCILLAYQTALAKAVQNNGPTIQAAINTNIVVIAAYNVATAQTAPTPMLAALTLATAASAAALVIHMARPVEIDVPGQ